MSEPIIDKVKSYIPDSKGIKDTFSSTTQTVSNSLGNVKSGVQNTLGAFSQKNVLNASNEFLQSNALFAKFAFIILIFIIFLALFKIGINLIGYMLQPSTNPYLIKGMIDGNSLVTISQNPSDPKSITVVRSVNAKTGIEFTWCVWLYIQFGSNDSCSKADLSRKTIFVKGTPGDYDSTTGMNKVNGPGMYLKQSQNGFVSMDVIMDDVLNKPNQLSLDNLPLKKWVHIAYRLENTILDIYVNGIITQRLQMKNAPKQNFYDIFIAPNGGFPGKLSNLQYFSRALNVFEINNMVMFGPNLKESSQSSSAGAATGNYSYISTSWYSDYYTR